MAVYFSAKDTSPVAIYMIQTYLSSIIAVTSNIIVGMCFFQVCVKITDTP